MSPHQACLDGVVTAQSRSCAIVMALRRRFALSLGRLRGLASAVKVWGRWMGARDEAKGKDVPMEFEVFLKEGLEITGEDECSPPYIIHFLMDSNNIVVARERAKILVKGLDLASGKIFSDDSERAKHLIWDAVIGNAHTDQRVMQALAFLLVYLCTETTEALSEILDGRIGKVGLLLLPADPAAAEEASEKSPFILRRVSAPPQVGTGTGRGRLH